MQILLRGGTLIDARGGEPLVNAGLLIEQGVILKIGAATDFAETPECPVVDCTGKTIIPGLINCHVHFLIEPYAWTVIKK